jgi:hypothetical protein
MLMGLFLRKFSLDYSLEIPQIILQKCLNLFFIMMSMFM